MQLACQAWFRETFMSDHSLNSSTGWRLTVTRRAASGGKWGRSGAAVAGRDEEDEKEEVAQGEEVRGRPVVLPFATFGYSC
jgi:hypothetical protein